MLAFLCWPKAIEDRPSKKTRKSIGFILFFSRQLFIKLFVGFHVISWFHPFLNHETTRMYTKRNLTQRSTGELFTFFCWQCLGIDQNEQAVGPVGAGGF